MASFLQSGEWQEIQERMGRRTRRIAGALAIQHDLPLGFHYFYCPRPGTLEHNFFGEAAKLAGETGAVFIKVDPATPSGSLVVSHSSLVIHPSHSIQPRSAVVIDCRKNDGELLASMHPKTRYNIRLAERHGAMVRMAAPHNVSKEFHGFWELLSETSRREKFSPHSQEHYRILLDVRSDDFWNELWLAELNGRILAAAIINWYSPSGAATYLHGASSRERREVMAPHLLHWRIIQEAGSRGFENYDFGGIDEKRWPGVTRFKQGFGGEIITHPPSCDVVFRPRLYWLYQMQHRLRHGL